MALHRDIHWIGRQWAVTGFGMQLIDQKLKGFFDIEAIRLWEDGLIEAMHTKEWLNKADFDKGLGIARKRYSGASGDVTPPLQEAVLPPAANGRIAPLSQAPKPEASKLQKTDPIVTAPKVAETRKPMTPGLSSRSTATQPLVQTALPALANGHAAPLAPVPKPDAPKQLGPIVAPPKAAETRKSVPLGLKITTVPPKPVPPKFHVQFTGSAKFVKPWRVMQKR